MIGVELGIVCEECKIMCACTTKQDWAASTSELNPFAPDFVPGRLFHYCLERGKGCGGVGTCVKIEEETRKLGLGEVLWGLAKGVVIGGLGSCKGIL